MTNNIHVGMKVFFSIKTDLKNFVLYKRVHVILWWYLIQTWDVLDVLPTTIAVLTFTEK